MARQCLICSHKDIKAITADLLAGAKIASSARKYGVSADALLRHKKNHLSAATSDANTISDAELNNLLTDLDITPEQVATNTPAQPAPRLN